jgi:hypothetical protein
VPRHPVNADEFLVSVKARKWRKETASIEPGENRNIEVELAFKATNGSRRTTSAESSELNAFCKSKKILAWSIKVY